MRSRSGFTIFELVISIAIFLALTATLLANFRQGDNSDQLRKSAELLSSYLREAQNKALSGINASTVNGYGVFLVGGATSYTTYHDQGTTVRQYDDPEALVTVNFLKNVSLSSATADVYFEIPTAKVYVNGVEQLNTLTMTLTHSNISKSVDITILPFSGQISVSDPY